MRKRKPTSPHNAPAKMIRKLHLSDGDIVLIKRDSHLATKDMLEALGDEFEKNYKFRVLFVVVDDFDDISKADDDILRKAGWIRWPRQRERNE